MNTNHKAKKVLSGFLILIIMWSGISSVFAGEDSFLKYAVNNGLVASSGIALYSSDSIEDIQDRLVNTDDTSAEAPVNEAAGPDEEDENENNKDENNLENTSEIETLPDLEENREVEQEIDGLGSFAEPIVPVILSDELSADGLLDAVYLSGASGKDTNSGSSIDQAVKTFNAAKERLAADGIIYISGKVTISSDEEWSLSDKGSAKVMRHEEYTGVLITFGSTGKTLTLTDIEIDGNEDVLSDGSIIDLAKNKTVLNIEDGTVIKNNRTTGNGGAISGSTATNASPVTITIRGQSTRIEGNEAEDYGGAIYLGNRYMTLNLEDGAVISGNTAERGGGIYSSGEVTLSGGAKVESNTALYVNPNGKDSASTSIHGGGGLYMASSTAPLVIEGRGTAVSGNYSADAGGGIYAKGNVTIDGGAVVEENICNTFGGGVYFYYSSGTMKIEGKGSGIYGNASVKEKDGFLLAGGGIYAVGHLSIKDGAVIKENTSEGKGGGIYFTGAQCNLEISGPDTAIWKNTSEDDGAGMYINSVKAADISDGVTISKNISQGNGGGIGIPVGKRDNLTISEGVRFLANRAAYGTLGEQPAGAAFNPASVTEPFENLYNNYDLLNTSGTQVQVITFHMNDGSADDREAGYKNDDVYTAVYDLVQKPENPQRSGYAFTGWFEDSQCTQAFEGWGQSTEKSLELYAGWTEQEETVTVDYYLCYDQGDPEANLYKSLNMTPGDKAVKPDDPEREGYVFSGWYKNISFAESDLYSFGEPVSQSLKLYAKWEQAHSVTFDLGYKSGYDDVFYRTSVIHGNTVDDPGSPLREGYNFIGWFPREGESETPKAYSFDVPVTDNLSLYASWEASQDYSAVYLSGSGNDDGFGTSTGTAFRTFEKALEKVEDGGTIYVTGQITINDDQLWSVNDKKDGVVVKRHKDYHGYLVQINEGGHLTLKNITIDGGAEDVDGRQSISAMLRVYNGGSLTVSEGAVLQNNITTVGYSGGAINVITDYKGTVRSRLVIEKDAVIRGNEFSGDSEGGGAVYAGSADVEIADSVLFENNKTGKSGGAVFIKTDTILEVKGAEQDFENGSRNDPENESRINFTANTAANDGGAIHVENSTLAVTGKVTFSGNKAGKDGGAISAPNNSDVRMTGPDILIFANKADEDGGAVYTAHSPVVLESGVAVTGNEAGKHGGGIYAYGGEIRITGRDTYLENNKAEGAGGGIYASDYYNENGMDGPVSFLIEEGAEIRNNSSGERGGGIYAQVNTQIVLQSGAKVIDNETKGPGGGIYTITDCYITITGQGTEVSRNQAASGGGIYAINTEKGFFRETAVLIEDGAVLSGNQALSGNGGGVYASNCTIVELSGGSGIINNEAGGNGGGLYIYSGLVDISDPETTVSGNQGRNGGGVYVGTGILDEAGLARGILTVSNRASIRENTAGSAANSQQSGSGNGGGIYVEEEAYLYLTDYSVIAGNKAYGNGGGLYGERGGHGTISTGAYAKGNSAMGHGGAAYSEGSLVIREGITIQGNSAGPDFFNKSEAGQEDVIQTATPPDADDPQLGNGGGIYIESGVFVMMPGASVEGNMADFGGGVFIGKEAIYVYLTGGVPSQTMLELLGIKDEDVDESYSGLSFKNNTVHYDGGGIYTHRLDILTVDEAQFSDNRARETVKTDLEEIYQQLHELKILNVSGFTGEYTFAYNNMDINFANDPLKYWALIRFHMNNKTDEIYDIQLFTQAGEQDIKVPMPDPEWDEYEFQGWFEDKKGTASYGFKEFFDEDASGTIIDVYAKWNNDDGDDGDGPGTDPGSPGTDGSKGGKDRNDVPKVETPDLTSNHFAYLVGYPDTLEGTSIPGGIGVTIRPNANITRAEAATIFFRMMTDEARQSHWSRTSGYDDVLFSHWFNNAVSTVEKGGYISGYDDGTFKPDSSITRAELAALAVRFIEDSSAIPVTVRFDDVSGHWAERDILIGASLGWVSGYGDGSFRPDEFITRAEVASILNQVLKRLPGDEDDLLDGMNIWPDNPVGSWHYLIMQEATNSHYYEIYEEDENRERWTSFREDPDWMSLERGDYRPVYNYKE